MQAGNVLSFCSGAWERGANLCHEFGEILVIFRVLRRGIEADALVEGEGGFEWLGGDLVFGKSTQP